MTEKPLSAVEQVKEESHGLRGDLAAQLAAGGDHFSDAGAQLLKFHGTYQQEDRDRRRWLGDCARKSCALPGRCRITCCRERGRIMRSGWTASRWRAARRGGSPTRFTARGTCRASSSSRSRSRMTIAATCTRTTWASWWSPREVGSRASMCWWAAAWGAPTV